MRSASDPLSYHGLFEVGSGPGTPIGERLRLLEAGGKKAVFFGSVPIYVYDTGDKEAESACMAMLSHTGLASDIAIAEAFGCHRNTVGRVARRLATEGMAAVVPAKRGPKGPHKVTRAATEIIEAESGRMSAPALVDVIAERTGVRLSVSYVRRLAAVYRPVQQELAGLEERSNDGDDQSDPELMGPDASRDTALDDNDDADGLAASDDDLDMAGEGFSAGSGEASSGRAFDPPSMPPMRVEGRYMGLALYYPAITALGLVAVARQVFALPRSILFGVRAVVLSVFFMTLLKKPTLESAKHLRRAEFGALIGTGRAPCVKTLRRKLDALVEQMRAHDFGAGLVRRWVEQGLVATAYLYIDGHMKIYSGKHKLQEIWNSQRRMPLPGVQTYYVADQAGRPLLFLTDELSTNLAKAMPRIIEEIRQVVGDQPFTVIFDRGGYDAGLFKWLNEQGIGFITYQKGSPNRPDGVFSRREARFEGRRVRFYLAEDTVTVKKTGPWRRIVVRARDRRHQTPIITNLDATIGPARIACLMFARWRQENLFKYMGSHHGLDQLIAYRFEPADADRLIANPQRKRLDREITELRKKASKLKAALGDAVLDEPKQAGRSVHGLKVAQGGGVSQLRALQADIDRLVAQRAELPKKVTVAESATGREVLRREHKAIIDRIKITAYNAEDWLLERLIRHYPNTDDIRDLLRSFAELSGQISTTEQGVTITLDPPDTPIHRRALRGLVADLNAAAATYPGTTLPVTYQVALHESELSLHHFEAVA